MKKFTKSIDITASPTKVWETLTGAETFTDWCSAFSEGCTFEGKWGKGETMKFLGPGPDGKVGGMVVKILDYEPNEHARSECIAVVHEGEVITEHVDGIEFIGSIEEYTLSGDGQNCTLTINQDVPESFYEMFSDAWPKALDRLKEIAEAK